jgi:Na+(H+)/acetate symporter ActP
VLLGELMMIPDRRRRTVNRILILVMVAAVLGGLLLAQWTQVLVQALLL